jgi:GNAT superfamily N-acetyltransferase
MDIFKNQFQNHIFLKAIVNSSLVGSVRAFQHEAVCYVGRLIVLPEYQGNGIGSKLLNTIEHYYKKVERFELFTGAQSNESLHLYKSRHAKDAIPGRSTAASMRQTVFIWLFPFHILASAVYNVDTTFFTSYANLRLVNQLIIIIKK